MKIVKPIISVVLIVTLLVSVLSVTGYAQLLVKNITDAMTSNSENASTDGENEDSSDNDNVVEEDVSNKIVLDPSVEGIESGAQLVWSEDFTDTVIEVSTDTDGNNVYSTDNYLVYYDDGTFSNRMLINTTTGDNMLQVSPWAVSSAENKPNMQVAFDFTKDFNKQNLMLSGSKFIVLDFDYVSFNYSDYVYFRYNIVGEDGESLSVLSESLVCHEGKLNGLYNIAQGGRDENGRIGTQVIALIAVDEEDITKSDLYYFIDNTDQAVVYEDFLKTTSSYIGSFEAVFVDPQDNQNHLFDNFSLYTFASGYEGNISNVLQEINFID